MRAAHDLDKFLLVGPQGFELCDLHLNLVELMYCFVFKSGTNNILKCSRCIHEFTIVLNFEFCFTLPSLALPWVFTLRKRFEQGLS